MTIDFEKDNNGVTFRDWYLSPSAAETDDALDEVLMERFRQETGKFSDQHLPDGTGGQITESIADMAKVINDQLIEKGEGLTWRHVLREEVYEAFAETDPEKLEDELIQVAAVAVRWYQDSRRRRGL